MQKNKQYHYDAVENWLRSTSEKALLELKEKCEFYRLTSDGNSNYYPYECVVWVYNKGLDGKKLSYETIAQQLNITPNKAHESKWLGLYLLGYRGGVEHPARTKRVAEEIEQTWRKHLAELKDENKKSFKSVETQFSAPQQLVNNLEVLILQDSKRHIVLLSTEIAELDAVIEPIEKDLGELKKWRKRLETIRKLEQKSIDIIIAKASA